MHRRSTPLALGLSLMLAACGAARFDAVVSGAEGLIPRGLEARHVETTWRHSGDGWVLVAADWSAPARGG